MVAKQNRAGHGSGQDTAPIQPSEIKCGGSSTNQTKIIAGDITCKDIKVNETVTVENLIVNGTVNRINQGGVNLSLCPVGGNVGIGVTNPTKLLEVRENTPSDGNTTMLRLEQHNTVTQGREDDGGVYTKCEIGQVHRTTGESYAHYRSAVWGINVMNEGYQEHGSMDNSSILCLQNGGGGSVVVGPSRNNNNFRFFVHGSGASTGGFSTYSDDRIKYHEQDITGALAILNKLKAQKYQKLIESVNQTGTWIPSDEEWDSVKDNVTEKGQRLYQYIEEIGFVAQDVKQIPELEFCVKGDESDNQGNQTPLFMNYHDIFALSIQGIQELDEELQAEKAKTASLETTVADLVARITALENA